MYTAALVREHGHSVTVDDDQFRESETYEDYEAALRTGLDGAPDVIFVRLALPSLLTDIEIARKFRQLWPASTLIAFGPLFASPDVVDYVADQRAFDAIVVSELESVVIELLDGAEPASVQGVYGIKDGEWLSLTPEPMYTDMQALPFAAYDLVDFQQTQRLTLQTQRGCPLACNYCPYYVAQGRKFRTKTAPRIVEELS